MLLYKGDKFIKGKKFTINESVYRFQKRDNNDNLIFEGINGSKLKLTEEEFNNKSRKVTEGIHSYGLGRSCHRKRSLTEGDGSARELAYSVVDNFKKITGRDLKDIFNYSNTEDAVVFNQDVVDETSDKIKEYLEDKGVNGWELDKVWEFLDDILIPMWNDYIPDDFDMNAVKDEKKPVSKNKSSGNDLAGKVNNIITDTAQSFLNDLDSASEDELTEYFGTSDPNVVSKVITNFEEKLEAVMKDELYLDQADLLQQLDFKNHSKRV
ncbi:MAG: hypothetical protein J6T15_05055 [Bacilli bacterium]|nr:hypothetical protein [Bacilli bacterium]